MYIAAEAAVRTECIGPGPQCMCVRCQRNYRKAEITPLGQIVGDFPLTCEHCGCWLPEQPENGDMWYCRDCEEWVHPEDDLRA